MQAVYHEFHAAGYAVLPGFLGEAELKLLRQVHMLRQLQYKLNTIL